MHSVLVHHLIIGHLIACHKATLLGPPRAKIYAELLQDQQPLELGPSDSRPSGHPKA